MISRNPARETHSTPLQTAISGRLRLISRNPARETHSTPLQTAISGRLRLIHATPQGEANRHRAGPSPETNAQPRTTQTLILAMTPA